MARSVAVAMLTAIAGCSDSHSPPLRPAAGSGAATGQSSQPPEPPRRFDPPKTFARTGVELPGITQVPKSHTSSTPMGTQVPWVLHDSTVYAADSEGRLQAIDAARGQVAAVLTPPSLPATAQQDSAGNQVLALVMPGRPIIAEVDGRPLVLFPELIAIPGRGTAAGRTVLDVMAVDPTTRAVAWTASVPVAGGAGPRISGVSPAPSILGVRGTMLVVAVNDQETGTVHGIDIGTKTAVWSKDGYLGQTVAGDSVITIQPRDGTNTMQKVTALSVTDGNPRWSLPNNLYETRVMPAGPTFVAVEARDYSSGKSTFRIVDGNTAADVIPAAQATSSFSTYGMSCAWDNKSVTVCSGVGIVMALDSTSGKELWRLPDQAANRVAPHVTTLWHGAVYGTAGNGAVVLDATTGQDIATPTIAPIQVSATTALAEDPTGDLRAYPATG